MTKNGKTVLLLIIAMLSGLLVRSYGRNWDQNQHLHPDERFLTMVTMAIKIPSNINDYFDTKNSTANPNNVGFDFYVYGTLPIYVVNSIAVFLGKLEYNFVTQLGRAMSTIYDSMTILVVGLCAWMTTKSRRIGVIALFIYMSFVLPIQQAHFFTVDASLVLFLSSTFVCVILPQKKTFGTVLAGVCYAAAITSKISALLHAPFLLLFALWSWKDDRKIVVISRMLLCAIVVAASVRLFQPSLFIGPSVIPEGINPKLIESFKYLKSFDGPNTPFPPAYQWIPLQQWWYLPLHTAIWGLGVPIIVLIFFGVVCIRERKKINIPLAIIIIWITTILGYQSMQFAKALRYVYPIYPLIAIVTAIGINTLITHKQKVGKIIAISCSVSGLIYTGAFLSIYAHPHSRVQASEWFITHAVPESTVLYEYWDDALPVSIPNKPWSGKILQLDLYAQDSPEKWKAISESLSSANYIMLSSNRLWRSLSALPGRYPQTSKYYQMLTNEKLGYKKVYDQTRYPCLTAFESSTAKETPLDLTPSPITFVATPFCTVAISDDGAEESFTVYDHPRVIIFENVDQLPAPNIYQKIMYE